MALINNNDLFLLEVIVKRNFSAKYKDSYLGIFWSILRPLATVVILSIIFSTVFKASITNFPVYLFSGRCIFMFFTESVGVAMNSLSNNKSILLKTSTPKYIFIVGAIISEFFNFLISICLLIGVMVVTNAPFHFTLIPFSIIPLISTIMMIGGLGLILSIASVYYTDIKHLWSILVMLLFYLCAIFYPMDIVPEPYHQYLILNPLFWVVDQFRCYIYYGTFPSLLNTVNSLLISSMILICGIFIFKRYSNKVLMKF